MKENSYLGSVRFFKHLLVGIPILLLLISILANIALATRVSAFLQRPEANPPEFTRIEERPSAGATAPVPPTPAPTAIELPGYAALYPEFYAPPGARATVNTEKTVFLTFDDGPSEKTAEILSTLDRYGVKATFFVVGQESEASKDLMRQIADSGHVLGMHSYSHDYKQIYASVEACLDDYNRIFHLIQDVTGVTPQVMRYPGGSINGYNGGIYQMVVAEMTRRGFAYFDWNVSAEDAVGRVKSAQVEAEYALKGIESLRRAVVLMHDSAGKKSTVEALPAIIEGYRDAGFTFEVLTPEVVSVVFNYPQ